MLLAAAVVAVVWANSPARDAYFSLWSTHVSVAGIDEDLQHWVNDGLMALFFFVVGLEIKRELVDGELSERRAATLPALAATAGAIAPALVFVLLAGGGAAASGWAIPMATDIAFAVGVLAVLGDRVSDGVKLLVLAIAVVDDIIAIAVIAVFYSDHIAARLAGRRARRGGARRRPAAGRCHARVHLCLGGRGAMGRDARVGRARDGRGRRARPPHAHG